MSDDPSPESPGTPSSGSGDRPPARLVRATVLFADVVGFTDLAESIGPERAYFVVTGAMRMLDEIARGHGGAVDKYLSDCLLATFGYPVPVADPAAAAAATAVEMRDEMRRYNASLEVPLRLVIGINTGPIAAGSVSGRVAREFNILGDAVNVAARLKAKAPYGHIYVGPETERESRELFEYHSLGAIPLKGKVVPVEIFALLGARAGSARAVSASDIPLVGRAAELTRLGEHLDRLRAGRGGTVLVAGAAGVGTSRLLAEAESLPAAAALTVVHAVGSAGEGEARLLASLLAACGDVATDTPSTVEGLAARIVGVLERRSAERPVLVLLDELHRADPSSLALVPQLAHRLAERPVLFLIAHRSGAEAETGAGPDAAGDSIAHTLAPMLIDTIDVGPLSPAESEHLIDGVASEPLSAESRMLVLAFGEGHPARLVRGVFFEPALRAERERAGSGRRTGDTERRRATILFADITGFTSLTERVGAELAFPVVAGCLHVLEDVTRKHGGTVEKLIGDCIMALFGFPEAIEDAPRVAVNAAIEMRRKVRAYSEALGAEMRLDVHTGIHTGLGIAGDVAGALVREFAVMGDPVSVADQLKDLAPAGDIYVGAEMWRATREVFTYEELPPSPRKGGGVPLRVFALRSDQERMHRARIGAERRVFSALVGRDQELAAVRAAVAGLTIGTGGIVSIVAVAGLGKSRLLREIATSPEAEGVAWCEGRSVATGRHLAYHAIVDLCRSLIGIEDGDDDAHALGKLDAMVRGLLPDEAEDDVLPFLAALLGLPLDDARRTRLADLHGDAMEKLTLRAVTQLLRATSRDRPVVAVMDDLHWADLSSIELFESLLHLVEDCPILFIVLCRPGYPTTSDRIRDYARKEHGDRATEITLAPLDGSAARSMLNNLFRQGDLPRETRQRIEEKAHGNPFYIEEVVRSLVDEGAVEYVDGTFQATAKIASVTIPDSIHEVVMARVDALDVAKRQLLQTASVIGASFHIEVLAGVGEKVAQLAEDIEALLHAEFLIRSSSARASEFEFKHPLIQEVTYESLLHARREVLHREVAETMERVIPDDVPGYTGMLAYHYGKGGVPERAEEFLFRAGAEAARAAAPSEALHFFEEASKLYLEIHRDGGDPTKRALLERNIAEALYYRGRFLDAIEHFNVALRLLGDRVVEGRWQLGTSFARNITAVLARLYGPRFRARPAATDRQREIMALRYARAEATVTTQPTRHLFDSMDTIAFLQRIDARSVPSAGKFYAGAAVLFAFGGISFDVARRFSEQAQALLHPDSLDEYIYERAMHFAFRMLEGDWSDAHEIGADQIAESVRNGQLWGPTTYLGLLAEKRLRRGDFAGARACLAEIDRIWDLFQYDLAKTNFYYLHTLLPLEEGDYARALEAAEAYYDENPEDLLHILALSAKAKAQIELGELERAEATLGHAAEVVTRSSPVPPFHGSAYHRSRLLFDLTRLEAALRSGTKLTRQHWRKQARKSLRTAMSSSTKVAWRRPEVLRLAGRFHWMLGHEWRARRLFEQSVECGERLGMRPETARTYAVVARFLAACGGSFRGLDAAACLARARAELEDLGLTTDLERQNGKAGASAPPSSVGSPPPAPGAPA